MKIAMFGGSFNPVHIGHIGLVNRMKELFSLDLVYVIPTFSTPLKDNTPMLPPSHRLNMCKLAFEEDSKVLVSDIEIVREGKSYTADTLRELSALHPSDELYLITGADSFMSLDKWYNPDEIFSLAHILTVSRGEYDASVLISKKESYEAKFKASISITLEPIAKVSSTDIRKAIAEDKEFTHLLTKKVSDYITENSLYGYEFK